MTFKRTIIAALATGALALGAAPSLAQDDAGAASMQEAIDALNAAFPGTLIHNPLATTWEPGGNDIRTKMVDAPELMTGRAMNVKVKKRQKKAWDTNYRADIGGEVKKGDRIQVFYFARTAKAARGMDTADVSLFLGRSEEPYDYIIADEFKPSDTWELKSMTGTANADFPEGTVKLEYQLGRSAQTVEFGPAYVTKLN